MFLKQGMGFQPIGLHFGGDALLAQSISTWFSNWRLERMISRFVKMVEISFSSF